MTRPSFKQNCRHYSAGSCLHPTIKTLASLVPADCILNRTVRDPRRPEGCMLQDRWPDRINIKKLNED